MSTLNKRIQFAEENIEEISDLYNAIRKIAWTTTFKMPKFEKFVNMFIELMVPAEKKEVMEPITDDWLDFEAENKLIHHDDEDDDSDFFFSSKENGGTNRNG